MLKVNLSEKGVLPLVQGDEPGSFVVGGCLSSLGSGLIFEQQKELLLLQLGDRVQSMRSS